MLVALYIRDVYYLDFEFLEPNCLRSNTTYMFLYICMYMYWLSIFNTLFKIPTKKLHKKRPKTAKRPFWKLNNKINKSLTLIFVPFELFFIVHHRWMLDFAVHLRLTGHRTQSFIKSWRMNFTRLINKNLLDIKTLPLNLQRRPFYWRNLLSFTKLLKIKLLVTFAGVDHSVR